MATPTALPSAFVAGDILTAANMNLIRGGFRVLQVIEGFTTTQTTNSTSTYADTSLTATITPTSTSSKILAIVNQSGCYKDGNSQSAVNIKLLRASTEIGKHNYVAYTNTAVINVAGSACIFVLDSPATISATIYKTQFANNANAASSIVQYDSSRSSLLLLEISA